MTDEKLKIMYITLMFELLYTIKDLFLMPMGNNLFLNNVGS